MSFVDFRVGAAPNACGPRCDAPVCKWTRRESGASRSSTGLRSGSGAAQHTLFSHFHATPTTVCPRMMRAASPGHLNLSTPSSSADVLERRRRALFQGSTRIMPPERSSQSRGSSSQDRYTLQPGPMPSERRQRLSKRPPSSLLVSNSHAQAPSPDDITARLYRQRFRQRCQAAMAREKSRSGVIAAIRGGNFQRTSSDSDDEDEEMPLNSDDLSSSDVDDDGKGGDWQNEDAEVRGLDVRLQTDETCRLTHFRVHSWFDASW